MLLPGLGHELHRLIYSHSAALGFLFDEPDLAVASTSGALAQASPATPPEPLFRPESASPEPPVNRKRKDSVIILGSDDDDDAPPRKLANKGKGRAVDSSDGVEIVPSPRKKKDRKSVV